eukprot:11131644-Prorocentrum_lima.AAC.1
MESWRAEHQRPFSETTRDEEGHIIRDGYERVCPWCELNLRWEEWDEMTDRERACLLYTSDAADDM